MIKFLIIAFIAYLMIRYIRNDLRRRFTPYQREPRPSVDAVDTVKCPRCGTFVAEGTAHECASPSG